jgi:hypothetical protein
MKQGEKWWVVNFDAMALSLEPEPTSMHSHPVSKLSAGRIVMALI